MSLKLLVERGADIYVKNKSSFTCGEAAAELDEETKEIFMNAVGVEDYQEIALLQAWKYRTRVEVRVPTILKRIIIFLLCRPLD